MRPHSLFSLGALTPPAQRTPRQYARKYARCVLPDATTTKKTETQESATTHPMHTIRVRRRTCPAQQIPTTLPRPDQTQPDLTRPEGT